MASHKWSEAEILKLAAGVESNTLHPIGKAIVEAAKALKCPIMKVHIFQSFGNLREIIWNHGTVKVSYLNSCFGYQALEDTFPKSFNLWMMVQ